MRARIVKIDAGQSVNRINAAFDGGWGLAHVTHGELPIVAGVERGSVEDEDWDFGLASPIMAGWVKFIFRPAFRVHDQIFQVPRFATQVVFDLAEELLFI